MDKIKKHTRQLTLAATVLAILASGPQVSLANSAPPTGGAAKVQVNAALRILPSGLQNIPAPDAVNGYKFNAYRNRPITLDLYAENVTNLGAFSYKMLWGATLAHADGVAFNYSFLFGCPPGPCPNQTRDFLHLVVDDPIVGTTTYPKVELFYVEDAVYSTLMNAPGTGPTGNGALERITMVPESVGNVDLFLSATKLAQVDGTVITTDAYNATMVVRASCMGDFDTNDKIEINDVQTIAYHYSDTTYDLLYDVDNSGAVNISDIQKVANRWNKTCNELTYDRVDSSPASKAAKSRMATNPASAKVQASPSGNTLVVSAQNLDRVGAFEIELAYNAKLTNIASVEMGDALNGSQRQWMALPLRSNTAAGRATFGVISLGDSAPALSGAGNLAKINLAALGKAAADAQVLKITLLDVEGNVMSTITPNQAISGTASADR